MSPRAAWRLAGLGYTSVFDYVAGKADWLAYGLPWHGSAQLIQPYVSRDVPTCLPDEQVSAVLQRLNSGALDMAVVVNEHQVVLGQLDATKVGDRDETLTAGEVMTEGPTTVRPSEEVDPLLTRMGKARVNRIIVTYPDGRLDGVFHRDDVVLRLSA
jgi:CBS domain-containing protein